MILDYLHEKGAVGDTPSEMANHFDRSRQSMNYYLKILEKEDYIECYVKSSVSFYRIKNTGSELFLHNTNNSSETPEQSFIDVEKSAPHYENLHNLHFVIPVIKQGDIIWTPTEKQLNNYIVKYGWLGPAYFEHSPSSWSLRFRLDGEKDPYHSTVKAYQTVFMLCELISKTYAMVFGMPRLVREPHYTIKDDPVAQEQKKPVYVPGVGHIDRSKDEGELEYYSPKTTADYIKLPMSVAEIRQQQAIHLDVLNRLVVAVDDLRINTPRLDVEVEETLKKVKKKLEESEKPPPKEMYG